MWAESFQPCSLRRMGFSEHEPWIPPRFPVEVFPYWIFFPQVFSDLRSDSILCKLSLSSVQFECNRSCCITYCYYLRCSAERAKIDLMVFLFMLYGVVEPKSVQYCKWSRDRKLSRTVPVFKFSTLHWGTKIVVIVVVFYLFVFSLWIKLTFERLWYSNVKPEAASAWNDTESLEPGRLGSDIWRKSI